MNIRKHALMTAVVATTTLGACTNPARFEQTGVENNSKSGAIFGGIVGAMIGMANGSTPEDRRDGAIKGAILGATAGGLIGKRLDEQAAALEASMGNDAVMIQNTGDSLIVTLPQDILFATDSTTLRDDLRRDLAALARNLQEYPNSNVQIIGHTDNVGSAAYNADLSLRRARSVADVIISQGVAATRITTIGRGESQPVDTNLTAEGRARNRRVEIVILPY